MVGITRCTAIEWITYIFSLMSVFPHHSGKVHEDVDFFFFIYHQIPTVWHIVLVQ